MIVTVGDKGQRAAVRRPLQIAILAVIEEQPDGLGLAVDAPHRMIGDIGELAARREFGRIAFGDLERRAAVQGRAPDRHLGLLQRRVRIGREIARCGPVGVMIAAPDIEQNPSVRRESELRDFLPVIGRVMRDLARRVSRRIRDPHIARAAQIAHEGDMAALRVGRDLADEGIVQHLLHGESRRRRDAAGSKRQQSQECEQSGLIHGIRPIAAPLSLAPDLVAGKARWPRDYSPVALGASSTRTACPPCAPASDRRSMLRAAPASAK